LDRTPPALRGDPGRSSGGAPAIPGARPRAAAGVYGAMTGADTRRLASARFEVVSDARARSLMRAALVGVLLVVALAAGLRLLADGTAMANERARLQHGNSALRAQVARL